MLIDDVTLSDLEIVRASDGSDGVLDLVDRTTTAAGRQALRRRLTNPMADAHQIRSAQEAIRFLGKHADLLRIDERALLVVERYFHSNIALTAESSLTARVEYGWLWLRYRDVLHEVLEGQAATKKLCRRVTELATELLEKEPPSAIEEVCASLRDVASSTLAVLASEPVVLADSRLRDSLKEDILGLIEGLGDLDALRSMALAGAELGWCTPTIVESEEFRFEAEDAFHPFVLSPVANPVELSGGEPVVFLTGPNMAGKTTYLRAVGLIVLLAQTGMDVPATSARLTPVEALFTSLSPSDNLKAGLSYFLAEVMRVKAAATLLAEGKRSLVLFDEVFKGTNVKDALEASAEVILGFAKATNSGFMFSSHLSELVESLSESGAIRFCFFDGEVVEGLPRFSYALQDGVSDKRFGLLLLEQANVPELLARISA